MRYHLLYGLLVPLVLSLAKCSSHRHEISAVPNILLILADDMGFSDLGCYGGEIRTPHLDQLAGEGLRFSQFYNAARCCPTRASLLTGLYPHQAGVGYMTEALDESPAYRGFLRKDRLTIAEMLHKAGYTTLHVGKWHVGDEHNHATPCERGFDRAWAPWSRVNYWNTDMIYEDGEIRKPNLVEMRYLTDVTGDKAIEYLDYAARKGSPFFLYLAFNAAHWPLHAKPEDVAKYRDSYRTGWDALREGRIARLDSYGILKSTNPVMTANPYVPLWKNIPEGDFYPGYHCLTSGMQDQDDWDQKMAVYAAQVTCMDENIGRIVDHLRDQGLLENTLIMFLQDNGACAEHIGKNDSIPPGGPGSYTAYHLPWAYFSNTPLRMYKHFLHEGGISTPFIVHWPDGLPEAQKGRIETRSFGHLIDIVPTCLAAAGINDPGLSYPLEGQNLLEIFRGAGDNADRTLFWEHEGNRCIRKGDWKLVSRYDNDVNFFQKWEFPVPRRTLEWELYNVAKDRWEQHECSSEYPDLVKELEREYEAYYMKIGAVPRKKIIKGSRYDF